MKRRMWAWSGACLCSAALVAFVAAQEKKPEGEPKKAPEAKKAEAPKADKPAAGKPEDDPMTEMMKKMEVLCKPSEAHKHLEPMAGKWDYQIRWWMDPTGEPQISKGTSEIKWIFDGRYLQQEVEAPPEPPMMEQPFHGRGLYGYDNVKQQYFSTWFDNMSTGLMVGWGTSDDGGKTIKMSGEYADPMSGDKAKKWRSVTKLDAKDKMVYETYVHAPDGKEYKEMEITYTRAR